MAKVKLTKGELKRQRDALRQYRRYLPTLQLKKQQLQMEILHHHELLVEKKKQESLKRNSLEGWVGLLASDNYIDVKPWIRTSEAVIKYRNIAGVDLPVFERLEFKGADYDLFSSPLWMDAGLEALRSLVSLIEEISILQRSMDILSRELRITTQRVNLFEKVKIPEAEEAIRLIKVFIGDQMANAVGRSKIAKRKIEESVLEGIAA
ncbi:MAG: V-type ATP synthase subunit D [Candidatus Omnitrophota bacterium]|jgi:V/A-type H+-transporting ATPase subunit D